MAAHMMHASIDGTSALEMDAPSEGFTFVRGGRSSVKDDAVSLFADDLHIAYKASGLSELSEALRGGSLAGSNRLPSGTGACIGTGIASFVIALAFLLV